MLYRFPQEVFINTAKDLVGQLQRACLLAFEIYNIDLSHIELLWTAGALACALKLFLRLTSSCLLCRFQRIQRGRSGKATALARWFLCFQDHNIRALWTRYRAFH